MSSHSHIIPTETRETLPLPVTCLVLCGGKSRRMGRAKAFLPFKGGSMVEHVLSTVKDLFAEVLIVANEPEAYENLEVDVVKDILPYRGPLGGILSGLLVAANEHCFVIACDMPLVSKKLVRELASKRHGNDVVVLSHRQGVEPLLGVYSKNCIKQLEESLFSDQLSVKDFLSGLKAQTFFYNPESPDESVLPQFFNVNTPQDYTRVITGVQPDVRQFVARNPISPFA